MTRAPDIVVLGATGVVGQRICAELARADAAYAVAGRSRSKLEPLTTAFGARIADVFDPAALARAFDGARVVIDATAPARDTAANVLSAALASGAHYVGVGGEQAALQALYEQHESQARRAGLVAVPAAGLDCVAGDLAAAWVAAHVADHIDAPPGSVGPTIRNEPGDRIAEDRPLDEIAVSYVFDELVLSAGSQQALFSSVGARPIVWHRDRWEPGRAGARRRVNAGAALGGERDAIAYAAGDALSIPRHVAVTDVATYVSTTRNAAAASALRLLATALPFVPARAARVLAPFSDERADYARTQFGIVVQVRRGFSSAQIVVRGSDIYRSTAASAAWVARKLVERGAGPIGMCAPGELFRGEPALRELAAIAEWIVEPSFGA